VRPQGIVYSDESEYEARARLLALDGVLVWVDPVGRAGEDRTILNALLSQIARAGVWVSAHPDTIDKMGTKEVLYRTRHLGWGSDTNLYETYRTFEARFPEGLVSGPRVLKQNRSNGGIGVWKVELVDVPYEASASRAAKLNAVVRVQHAAPRDAVTEDMTLGTFMARCREYFSADGRLIDQPFASRLVEGMIRAYFVKDEVVGFARQQPAALSLELEVPPPDQVLGLPAAKTMYPPDEAVFSVLRRNLEDDWVPTMQTVVGVDTADLPILWDADFLYGPKTPAGDDTYILCEINTSSVTPFPSEAVRKLAHAVRARLEANP
jgi:hypothetical protein